MSDCKITEQMHYKIMNGEYQKGAKKISSVTWEEKHIYCLKTIMDGEGQMEIIKQNLG